MSFSALSIIQDLMGVPGAKFYDGKKQQLFYVSGSTRLVSRLHSHGGFPLDDVKAGFDFEEVVKDARTQGSVNQLTYPVLMVFQDSFDGAVPEEVSADQFTASIVPRTYVLPTALYIYSILEGGIIKPPAYERKLDDDLAYLMNRTRLMGEESFNPDRLAGKVNMFNFVQDRYDQFDKSRIVIDGQDIPFESMIRMAREICTLSDETSTVDVYRFVEEFSPKSLPTPEEHEQLMRIKQIQYMIIDAASREEIGHPNYFGVTQTEADFLLKLEEEHTSSSDPPSRIVVADAEELEQLDPKFLEGLDIVYMQIVRGYPKVDIRP